MEVDDDDDVHLCLRCRETIVGLDSYILHKRSRSCKPIEVSAKNENVTIIENTKNDQGNNKNQKNNKINQNNKDSKTRSTSYVNKQSKKQKNSSTTESKSDPSLKADDFFSLLELQSSTKSSTCLGNITSNVTAGNKFDRFKPHYGIVTRSKSSAKAKDTSKANQQIKDFKDCDNIRVNKEIPESSSSTFDNNSTTLISEKDDTQLELSNTENDLNLTDVNKPISEFKNIENPVDGNCMTLPLTDGICNETTENTSSYQSQSHSKDNLDEDIEEDEDGEDEDYEEEYEGSDHPPRTHTGGKWKPGGFPSSGSVQTHYSNYNWRNEHSWSSHPPPTHTGGKWKPQIPFSSETKLSSSQNSQHQQQISERPPQPQRYLNHPPPGHTRGKWMPIGDGCNIRKAGNQVQYWCGVCNRRLSSRGIYERHLKSHLHAKRTRQERQLDEDILSSVSSNRPSRLSRRIQNISKATNKTVSTKQDGKRTRKLIICEICGARVWRHQMGKHLVSRFHCKRAEGHPAAGKLILANMTAMVHQAPFHCTLCAFYCNTMEQLILHWDSELHLSNDSKNTGRYWCSYCQFDCESSSGMKYHLLSGTHQEVVDLINKSVPVLIQKLILLKCPHPGCDQAFRFNIELKKHARLMNHDVTSCSASDLYQEKIGCPHCHQVFHSRRHLNKHLSTRHNIKSKYFCSDCNLKFLGRDEVESHRRSKQHKYNVLRKRINKSKLQRKCPYCDEVLADVPELKNHLQQLHPENNHRCIKCGASYTLKQELSRHVRYQCKGLQTTNISQSVDENDIIDDDDDEDDLWSNKCVDKWVSPMATTSVNDPQLTNDMRCSKCSFTSTSKTELIFHTALHSDPVLQLEEGIKPQNLVPKYVCPLCPRSFRKDCLKNHIKTHTGERLHVCDECGSRFARRDVLSKHKKVVHRNSQSSTTVNCDTCNLSFAGVSSLKRHLACHNPRSKGFLCAECGAAFYDKTSLQQHIQIHSGKKVVCTEPGCVYRCRSSTELKYHLRTHSDQRPFSCEHCTYTSKTKAQLSRHSKKHLGLAGREYKCQYCGFKGATSSHLRRHLRLHTGARPYHCPYCSYKCNLLENLRKHVLSTKKHPGRNLYSCSEENCQFTNNSAKEFRSHLVLKHNKNVAHAAAYVTGLYRSNEDYATAEDRVHSGKNDDNEIQVHQIIPDTCNKSYLSNPTLASVANRQEDPISAVTVTEPTDEIIYIQLPSDDALDNYDSGVPFFSPTEHFLNSSERPLFFETLPPRTITTSISLSDSTTLLTTTDNERELIVIGESTVELLSTEVKKK